MQEDVAGVGGTVGDVCYRRVPVEPQRMQALFLEFPAPLGVLLLG